MDVKNTSRKELIALCIGIGNFATAIANDNIDAINESRLPLRKIAQRRVLGNPINLTIKQAKTQESFS